MKPTFTISVDVEDFFLPRPITEMYLGNVNGKYYAVPLIIEIAEKYNCKATFFVDVMNVDQLVEEGIIRECCQEIVIRGHELALHTHPPKRKGIQYINARAMCNYDFDSQYAFIEKSLEKINKWTNIKPVSHRAGGYAMNINTLKALYQTGFAIDSSVFWGSRKFEDLHPVLAKEYGNIGCFQIEGIKQFPVVSYQLQLFLIMRLKKKFDLNWASRNELLKVISFEYKRLDFFLHSYSFFNEQTLLPEPYFIESFEAILEHLVLNYSNSRFMDLQQWPSYIEKEKTLSYSFLNYSFKDYKNIYLPKIFWRMKKFVKKGSVAT